MRAESSQRLLVRRSIDLIGEHQAPTGAYVASPGYDSYGYCWLRDGAFIAASMDSHGHHSGAEAFHRWAARTIELHAHKVDRLEEEAEEALHGTSNALQPLDDRYVLHTRFTVDGREGDASWGNFQLDGYGFWLTSVATHLTTSGADPEPYLAAIDVVRRYLTLSWDRPCFDSWEEYPTRRHTTTWAAIAKGLLASNEVNDDAAVPALSQEIAGRLTDDAEPSGTLPKFVVDPPGGQVSANVPRPSDPDGFAVAGHERIGQALEAGAIDGSALLVLGDFGPFPKNHQVVMETLRTIESDLVVGGGVHRYLEDEYYGGGLWIVLAGALACVQAVHDPDRANLVLDWIEDQADASGHFPEQVATHLRKPESLDPWIDRWGASARPLLWSHAMYLLAVAAVRPVSES